MNHQSRPLVVGIAGGSGSGKTTLVRHLEERLKDIGTSSLCFDCYYNEYSHLPFEARERINFDAPDSFDHALFRLHLQTLIDGSAINAPIYDYVDHIRQKVSNFVSSAPVIILDGFLLLFDEETRKKIDITAFIDVPADIRFERRMKRDISERGRTIECVTRWWEERVYPSHLAYCEPTKNVADFVLGDRDTWDRLENEIRSRLSSGLVSQPHEEA